MQWEYFLNYAIGMRQDYASDCDGILNIDGVTVMWDRGYRMVQHDPVI